MDVPDLDDTRFDLGDAVQRLDGRVAQENSEDSWYRRSTRSDRCLGSQLHPDCTVAIPGHTAAGMDRIVCHGRIPRRLYFLRNSWTAAIGGSRGVRWLGDE